MQYLLLIEILAIRFQINTYSITGTSHEFHSCSYYRKLNCLFNNLIILATKKAANLRIIDYLWRKPWPVDSPIERSIMRKTFSCHDIITVTLLVMFISKGEIIIILRNLCISYEGRGFFYPFYVTLKTQSSAEWHSRLDARPLWENDHDKGDQIQLPHQASRTTHVSFQYTVICVIEEVGDCL